ncbi:DUF1616 domain-containing protein [Chloroflexota bacterium]
MLKRRFELDLFIVGILTLVLVFIAFVSAESWLRTILGFLFIVFSPGYVLVAAVFPSKDSLSTTTRIAFSLGLSIVVAIFIGLILDFTPWGIDLYSLLLSLALFILLVSGIAWYVRGRISPEERFGVDFTLFFDGLRLTLRTASKKYRTSVIILICVILGGSGSLGFAMAKPVPKQPFTEFYILGMEGKAGNYPKELTPGEEGKVMVGIVNHEQRQIDYRLEVLVDSDKQYELSSIQLTPGEQWERTVIFTIQKISYRQKVEFLLYKSGEQLSEIRYLWVDVRE